jgi:hypothetical protein
MKFESIEYMEWAKLESKAGINLSRSGVAGLELKDLDMDLTGLEINGDHSYGYPPLLEAIAARYGAQEDQVVPAVGTSLAVFIACAAVLEKGDGVAIEKPAYEPLRSVPRAIGAEITRFERPYEVGYKVDRDRFGSALAANPKLVILTNLHNPSGAYLARPQIQALAFEAQRKGAFVFVDEVYLEYMAGSEAGSSFGLAENIIVASSLTKVFGLAGFRCGWLLAPAPLARKMRRVMDHLTVEHVYIAEQLAARAFPLLDAIKERNRPLFENNRRTVRNFIRETDELEWQEPAGGVIGFPRVKGPFDGDALARILREQYDTSVVPGRFFEDSRHFRLGFGVPPQTLAQGLENIKKALGSNLHF